MQESDSGIFSPSEMFCTLKEHGENIKLTFQKKKKILIVWDGDQPQDGGLHRRGQRPTRAPATSQGEQEGFPASPPLCERPPPSLGWGEASGSPSQGGPG